MVKGRAEIGAAFLLIMQINNMLGLGCTMVHPYWHTMGAMQKYEV